MTKNFKEQKANQKNAFTLIEMLVAASVFSLIVSAITGIFGLGLGSQRYVLSSGVLLDETSYSLEYISRALRMARKDRAGVCVSPPGPFSTSTQRDIGGYSYSGLGIKFLRYDNVCQEFFLDESDARLKENKDGYMEPIPLTSNKLRISSFKCEIFQGETVQPRATISLEIEGGSSGRYQPEIKIQTTVSQRNLNL